MNISDQKELIRGIINYKKNLKVSNIEPFRKVENSVYSQLTGDKDSQINLEEDLDSFFDWCEFKNIQPIHFLEKVMDQISSVGVIQTELGPVDLSKGEDILNKVKDKFKTYKENEDINNF